MISIEAEKENEPLFSNPDGVCGSQNKLNINEISENY